MSDIRVIQRVVIRSQRCVAVLCAVVWTADCAHGAERETRATAELLSYWRAETGCVPLRARVWIRGGSVGA